MLDSRRMRVLVISQFPPLRRLASALTADTSTKRMGRGLPPAVSQPTVMPYQNPIR